MKRAWYCLALILLTGCAELKPSWQGLWMGVETVGPMNQAPTPDDVDAEMDAIVGLGQKNSLQMGVYQPVVGGWPGYRMAIMRRVW